MISCFSLYPLPVFSHYYFFCPRAGFGVDFFSPHLFSLALLVPQALVKYHSMVSSQKHCAEGSRWQKEELHHCHTTQQPNPTKEGKRQPFNMYWLLPLWSWPHNHTEPSIMHIEADVRSKKKSFKANSSLRDFIPALLHSATAWW